MRRLNIFLALALLLLTSCMTDDVYVAGGAKPTNGGFRIIGAPEDFDAKRVGTRADDDTSVSDSHISEMTMFIFKADGNIIQGYKSRNATFDSDGNLTAVNFDGCETCSSAINIQKGNPTFLVDTQEGIIASLDGDTQTMVYYDNLNADDIGECKIYIVANAYHQIKPLIDAQSITSLADLEAVILDIDDSLDIPKKDDGTYRGFPMIGTHKEGTFKLKSGDKNDYNVAQIPLKKLYSKVCFTMQVCANQVVSTQVPKFEIEKVEVFNVPNKVHMGRQLNATDNKPVYGTTTADDYLAEMGVTGTFTPSDLYHFTETPFVIDQFDKNIIYHDDSENQTDDIIEFEFYMPEHKVMPNTITYPAGIEEEFKQYYKPLGVGAVRNEDGTTDAAKVATFVRIHGVYTDHNAQIKDVRYDIYLGQNNTDDFTVKRNQQLNNKLVITGLTNYHDAYGGGEHISIDHRVDVDYKGFNLSMERTAILDSHFEVRPLDVELSPGSYMVVTIPEAYRSWVAMESDAAAKGGSSSVYVNTTDDRKGVRKYFTTNLVSELKTANSGTIELTHSGESDGTELYRIWFYIDENPNVYDKLYDKEGDDSAPNDSSPSDGYTVYGVKLTAEETTAGITDPKYRICPVEFKYYGTDNDSTGGVATVSKTVTINFQQWNLWRVWSADGARFYDIEHEEEYLHNYASNEAYGQTEPGMRWGLEGIQLSNDIMAYWTEPANGTLAWIVDLIFGTNEQANSVFAQSGRAPQYDFYLTRDGFPTGKLDSSVDKTLYARDYSGLQFNKEIATTLKASSDPKAKIDGIILTEDPISAFAYCYHKNKRNADGTIAVDNIKWFLPAIDEIEDIALGAYEEFDETFQKKPYWSCQPAYNYNDLSIKGIFYGMNLSTLKGEFYEDNKDRARATSVYRVDATNYTTIQSGLPSGVKSGSLSVSAYRGGSKDGEAETSYASNNIDYNSEIYTTGEYSGNKSRTDKCRIRAVYRSGTK